MLYEKICAIICDQLALTPEEISRETSFVDDLGCDSLDVVEITMALEEQFGLHEIPEEDLKTLTTVGALVDYAARFVPEA